MRVFIKMSALQSDARVSCLRGLRIARLVHLLGFVAVIFSLGVACSTLSNRPEGTWSSSYFSNPDAVWAGIELTLDQLGYEITDSNRPDGKIRAEPAESGDGTDVVLLIDQIARTDDQVIVYVKPLSGNSETPATSAQIEAAARDFLAVLDRKLGG